MVSVVPRPIADGSAVPQLHVRNVPDDVVTELKQRAARHGRSMEAEHRQILLDTLRPRFSKKRLLAALQSLPFDDSEFRPERSRDTGREQRRLGAAQP